MILVGIDITPYAPDNIGFPNDPPGSWLAYSAPNIAGIIGWLERRLERPANRFVFRSHGSRIRVMAMRDAGDMPSSLNPPILMIEIFHGIDFDTLNAARQARLAELNAQQERAA